MSQNRTSKKGGWCDPSKLPRGPNGRALCRQCNTEVPKGRRTFCSNECVDEWKVKTDPGHARHLVNNRDKGICVLCRLDCNRLKVMLDRSYGTKAIRIKHLFYFVTGRPHTSKFAMWRSLWEMDHTVPVSEGGGECGLDNLRTLCVWCHNTVTADLRKRLAWEKKRRNAKQLGFDMPPKDPG